jgi:hypothetical protein
MKKKELSEFIFDKHGKPVTLEREEKLIEAIRKRGGNTLRRVEAKNGFSGRISKKTLLTVGEGGKKEFVSREIDKLESYAESGFTKKSTKSNRRKDDVFRGIGL